LVSNKNKALEFQCALLCPYCAKGHKPTIAFPKRMNDYFHSICWEYSTGTLFYDDLICKANKLRKENTWIKNLMRGISSLWTRKQ